MGVRTGVTRAKKTPYWWKAIEAAKKRGFSRQDSLKAASWTTCACGEQDPRIPRRPLDDFYHPAGSPKDRSLRNYGMGFYFAVKDGSADLAAKWLTKIEARSALILKRLRLKKASKSAPKKQLRRNSKNG